MMDETTDDGVAAWRKTSHKAHQLVLTEIERNRVDSLEGRWDYRTSGSIQRIKGNRACITDMGRNVSRVQSHGVDQPDRGQVDKMDADSIKYATLSLRSNRPRANDTDKQKIREGMLYKTSRGKITSNLIRGQHEHRQHRRFQLTEHSLEYSQLLQRVCDNSYTYKIAKIAVYLHNNNNNNNNSYIELYSS